MGLGSLGVSVERWVTMGKPFRYAHAFSIFGLGLLLRAVMFSPEQSYASAGSCLLLIITVLLLPGKRGAELRAGLQATACPVCVGPASVFPLSSR